LFIDGKKEHTIMDTDDLSNETYKAIILASDRFHHDLTLQFGVLAEYCNTDDEFLIASEKMIKKWLSESDMENVIEDIFFDIPPNKKDFKNILLKILENILKVRKIEISKRQFD
jgi:hypothetical protein